MILKGVHAPLLNVYPKVRIDPFIGEALPGNLTIPITNGVKPYVLSETVALGVDIHDRPGTIEALTEARRGRRAVEVRIGVGPLLGPLPARVLAYAEYVRRALIDAANLAGPIQRIGIFSSAPKSRVSDPGRIALSVAALGLALRSLQGPSDTILALSAAKPVQEVPDLPVRLSEGLRGWLDGRLERYAETARGDLNYAYEHSAGSMFGDLSPDPVFRITIGGSNEGRFWAARVAVRDAARQAGITVAPAVALSLPGLRVPWYSPTPKEPSIDDARLLYPDNLAKRLEDAANPSKEGNAGLKREATAFRQLAQRFDFQSFQRDIQNPCAALDAARTIGIEVDTKLYDPL